MICFGSAKCSHSWFTFNKTSFVFIIKCILPCGALYILCCVERFVSPYLGCYRMPYISKLEVGQFSLQFIPKRFGNRETSGRIVYLRELSCDNGQRRINMKYQRIYLALSVLLLASLACQTLSGGGGGGNQPTVAVTESGPGAGGATSDSGFPM